MTGAWVDREQGLLSLIALELGVSSRLVAYLKKGEPVVVMGPTATPPTSVPSTQVPAENGCSVIAWFAAPSTRPTRYAGVPPVAATPIRLGAFGGTTTV